MYNLLAGNGLQPVKERQIIIPRKFFRALQGRIKETAQRFELGIPRFRKHLCF